MLLPVKQSSKDLKQYQLIAMSKQTMKIRVRNLGILKQDEIELGNLTTICGDNNGGKTYIAHALFGFLSLWRSVVRFTGTKLWVCLTKETG